MAFALASQDWSIRNAVAEAGRQQEKWIVACGFQIATNLL